MDSTHVPGRRKPVARILVILLGIGLLVAASFGVFSAELSLGNVSHSQQGYSCTVPVNGPTCSALAAQEQLWDGVLAISILAFVAGFLILVIPLGRRLLQD